MAIAFEDSRRALEQQLSTKLDIVHVIQVIFLSTLALWAFTGKIDLYRTSQSGTLKNEAGALIVQSEVWATIKHSSLSLGQKVEKGQLLLQLDDTPARLTLSKLTDELTANAQQKAILNEQRQLTAQKYQLFQSSLESEIRQIQAQLEQSDQVLATQKKILDGYKELSKTSAVAKMDLLRQELEVVRAQATAKVNKIALSNKRQQIPRNQREQDLAISQIDAQLSALNDQQEQLNRAITRAELEVDKYAVVAANSGEVVQLVALPTGNRVDIGQKLATLSNSSAWLIHSQFKATDAIGHIKEGQSARILVDGFPWRQYGSLEATVTHVAKEGIRNQVDVLLTLNPNPDSQIPLTFGQPVTVEIKTQELSPMLLLLNAVDRATRTHVGSNDS